MASQFFGLNISYTGLLAANASLNTTANNISNAETEGYSRQTAIQEACNPLRTYTSYGSAGAGVDTTSIKRMHDDFYDTKFWDNASRLGTASAKAYYMKSIENFFQDSDTISGFNTTFDLMFNALEELQKNAGSDSAKAQFVMYAQSLCDYFSSVAGQLSELQKDINTEIKDTVTDINSIAEQIATLNKQINVIELTGAHANELRDKRTLLIDKLSEYVSVDTQEIPIVDTANNLNTGANRYIVKIAGNQLLVDTNDFHSLACQARELNETVNQSDESGLYEIKWEDGAEFNLYSTMVGGKLQGLIELRDGNNTENFRGTVAEVNVSKNTVKIAVTEDFAKDMDKCTLSSHGGTINLGAETYYYTDWSYSYDTQTGECFYEFSLDAYYGDNHLSPSRIGREAKVGESIDYKGIPYYQEQLNEFVRLFARVFNNTLTSEGAVDGKGNLITDRDDNFLFKGVNANGGQLSFKDYVDEYKAVEDGTDTVINFTNSSGSYYKLTASNFTINEKFLKDAGYLATRTETTDGVSKADIVENLLAIKTDKDRLSFRGGSSSEFLQSVLSDVALSTSRAKNSVSYYESMNTIVTNQRLSISGVDSDEEAVSLVKFKNSYDLASKMIQTFTEIYDRLILETGV